MDRKDPSMAPAHGGVGDTTTTGGCEPGLRKATASAATAATATGRLSGLAGGGVGAGEVLGLGNGRRGKNRVTMLGSALDDVENRGDGPRGKVGKGGRDREEKVCGGHSLRSRTMVQRWKKNLRSIQP